MRKLWWSPRILKKKCYRTKLWSSFRFGS